VDKLGRNYRLEVQEVVDSDKYIIIEPPMTLEIDIIRNVLSTSTNACKVRIYNLSQDNRAKIYKDAFDFDLRKKISLYAGYGNNLSLIFTGNISKAWSVREGTNFITEIESYDGGYAWISAEDNVSYDHGALTRDVMLELIGRLKPYGVDLGKVGEFPGNQDRAAILNGNICKNLADRVANYFNPVTNKIDPGQFFIDNGKAYCLRDYETFTGDYLVINSASGLLGTPTRHETYLTFDMIFEPRLMIGQEVTIDSITAPEFNSYKAGTNQIINGNFKVVSLHHRGVISDAVAGTMVTTAGVFWGANSLTTVYEDRKKWIA
jgi:hypothetical protein